MLFASVPPVVPGRLVAVTTMTRPATTTGVPSPTMRLGRSPNMAIAKATAKIGETATIGDVRVGPIIEMAVKLSNLATGKLNAAKSANQTNAYAGWLFISASLNARAKETAMMAPTNTVTKVAVVAGNRCVAIRINIAPAPKPKAPSTANTIASAKESQPLRSQT